ncbi:MAG: lipopolysaccharide biosynthesis protein [Lachnospiraceae bacterium]
MTQKQKNVFWNMIYSLMNAGQSFLLLFLVNHLLGEEQSGIFSYGFSVAVLFMYIGNYGIRNYQVSDTGEKYSFTEYYSFRFLTIGIMLLIAGVDCLFFVKDTAKAMIIFSLCLFRAGECLEDVFHGRFQQKENLALACQLGTFRYLVSDLIFFLTLILLKQLLPACICYAVSTIAGAWFFNVRKLRGDAPLRISISFLKIKLLLAEAFPLFAGYFLTTYLTNVGKYAINKYLDEIVQAHFNMLFMPVLLINLLSTMIFRPGIVEMARLYNEKKKKEYYGFVSKQLFAIGLLSVVVLPICYFIGVPFLSWFYGSDLSAYSMEFMILMFGGVCSAVISFLNVCIITIRGQQPELWTTLGISVISAGITYYATKGYGLFGTCVSYVISMVLLAVSYLVLHGIIAGKHFEN